VPPLLQEHLPDHFIVLSLQGWKSQRRVSAWKQIGSYYEPRSAAKKSECQPRGIPRLVLSRRHQTIIYANAAARALGIVPDKGAAP
jgi:hypothetical protein